MIKISKYLNPEQVAFLEVDHQDEVLKALIELASKTGKIHNQAAFFNSILEREKIVSTGIGMGVAIPHAKLPDYEDFFICIGILRKAVDWNALDGSPVRLVFMIGGPDDKQTEYLQILSNLTLAIKDEARRKNMLTSNSPQAIIQLFNAF